jgi:toxin ParE1/3/4
VISWKSGFTSRRTKVRTRLTIDRIEARCRQLAEFPESGPPRPDIADDARMLVIVRWLALYEITKDGVRIIRVVDAARNLGELDLSGE